MFTKVTREDKMKVKQSLSFYIPFWVKKYF